MKKLSSLLIALLMFAVFSGFADRALAQSELLTFDDLPPLGYAPVPNGYGGLQWENVWFMDHIYPTPSGYQNGVVSPVNVAYDYGAATAFLSGALFNMDSGYLTAAWNDDLQIEVQGFVGNALTYDNVYTVSATGPTFINFNYLGVDKVSFTPSGGIPHYGDHGDMFVLDNLHVTIIPEPSVLAMGVVGAVLIALRRLKKQNLRRQ